MTSPGQELIGRYQLVERLGSGGMGSVWRAKDLLLDREVALKELVPQRHGGEDLARRRERARKEARMLARVEHPAVVSVHDLITVDDDPWIVMGYFRGRSLDKIIHDDPPMDDQELASIALPVLHGLIAAHDKGVVHRDIKPPNILVAKDRSVCLVDFGIAKVVGDAPTSGLVFGTLEYLAPERFEGKSGAPSDLWSLGVTLYYALERRTPFASGSHEATIAAIANKEPPVPRRGGALAEIVLQMLRKNPADRPDAAAVAAVLKAVLRGRGGSRRPTREPAREIRHQSAGNGNPVPSLSGMPFEDAAAIISGSATRSGVATLLQMSNRDAARTLDQCEYPVAGELLGGIAAEQPSRAGKILEIVAVDRVGRVLDYMSQPAAAATLAVMPVSEAARILHECEVRTAANALSVMRSRTAGDLLGALDGQRAAAVLRHSSPVVVAAILKEVPSQLRWSLLHRLPAQFRALVRRYM